MIIQQVLGITLVGAFLVAAAPAQELPEESEPDQPAAPAGADDYVAVWSVIEQQWEAAERGDKGWVERFLHDEFRGWPRESPAPRDKASTRTWDEFGTKLAKGLEHELYPLSTVIYGDTAVAHYLYTSATEDKDGKAEIVNGRYTDVLVRVGTEWKFIAWHGGADRKAD